ncbi:hypothetical protein ATCC90586_008534 [Pythium insidiosum]|nr:hypothetical protein ATCC90586_008534 [Pythium insidiosum]
MGNACCCCCAWLCPAPETQPTKGSKSAKRTDSSCSSTCRTKLLQDDDDTWFEHDKTPLISSQHDADGDDTQVLHASGGCVVKKTVVMRSPKAVHFEDMERRTETRAGGAASTSPSSSARGLRAVDRDADSARHHHRRRQDEAEATPPRSPLAEPRSAESSSSSSDDFERVSVSPDAIAAEQQDRAAVEDRGDGDDERERAASSPRSPGRPSSDAGSPKKKKERYGRKNYRANSSRKKNL